MKNTSRFTRVVGVFSLAALLVTGLTACGNAADMNEDYLVLADVESLDCSAVNTEEMQATVDFVSTASSIQETDILALNPGLTSLEPLTAAQNAKIASCGGTVAEAADVDTDGANDTITLSPELMALLDAANAPLDQYSCVKIVGDTGGTVIDGTYTLFVNTLLEVDEGNLDLRQWSDALSTVLKGASVEEMRTWINRAICEEPVIGVSLAHLFANLKIGDVTVLSLQSTDWLTPFAVDASQINDLVAQYTPLTVWRLQNFGKQDIPEDVYLGALTANHEYQELASRLVFLLSRYELATQVTTIDSTHHYHLVGGGLTADNIPEVEVSNEVDSRPALVFYLTEKTACKPISVLGFNTGDKRPMLGSVPESCETFVPPPPAPPTTENPPSNPPSNPPGNPPRVCPPDMPHGTWPICKDSPTRDPEQQGNNRPGGGGQAPAQTDPVGPPAAGEPPAVYTPPPAVQQPAPPVVPQPAQPGPAPTVDPGTQPPNNGEVVAPPAGSECTPEAREFGLC